jgi:hypothetical protein
MITRDEIDSAAASLSVLPSDVERDYVNGWLLAGIFGVSSLEADLLLKGGNALRKGVLFEHAILEGPGLHRAEWHRSRASALRDAQRNPLRQREDGAAIPR